MDEFDAEPTPKIERPSLVVLAQHGLSPHLGFSEAFTLYAAGEQLEVPGHLSCCYDTEILVLPPTLPGNDAGFGKPDASPSRPGVGQAPEMSLGDQVRRVLMQAQNDTQRVPSGEHHDGQVLGQIIGQVVRGHDEEGRS